MNENMLNRKKVVFVSSSFVNLAKEFAEHYFEFDVFLIFDRKFPFEFEDMENFYPFTFNYQKLYDRDKEKYFDNLSVFINEFDPDVIVTNNFNKVLPKSFIDFMKFRNSKIEIINVHHGDLRCGDEFKGLDADMKEFIQNQEIISTILKVEDEKMNGEMLAFSEPTEFKELKLKKLVSKTSDIMNLRIRNVILTYHEKTKVLRTLYESICSLVYPKK